MWPMHCSIVRVVYIWCKEGHGMHDSMVNSLVMTGLVLVVILLGIDDSLGMAVFEIAACFLWAGMSDGLGICDCFLTGSALEFCGGHGGLEMGLCLE